MCGRDKKESKILIAGINGHVCDNCVTQAYGIIKEESVGEQKQQVQHALNLLKPRTIKEKLDEYVIGQDDAGLCEKAASLDQAVPRALPLR